MKLSKKFIKLKKKSYKWGFCATCGKKDIYDLNITQAQIETLGKPDLNFFMNNIVTKKEFNELLALKETH